MLNHGYNSSIQWLCPLQVAAAIESEQDNFVMLHSGVLPELSPDTPPLAGRLSIIAWDLREQIKSSSFAELEQNLKIDIKAVKSPQSYWFGYLGYGLKNSLENLAEDGASYITLPDLWLARFNNVVVFDNISQQIQVFGITPKELEEMLRATPAITPATTQASNSITPTIDSLYSNMKADEYLDKVQILKEHILSGDIYQANLTRKFYGEFATTTPGFTLFKRLCEIAPAPYSAFLKFGDVKIISSSMERFLNMDASGNISAIPIKGTARRRELPADDQKAKDDLLKSEKNRSENLMIVDLMRNDLSRVAKPGSVKVEKLFELTSYAAVHHLSSLISAQVADDKSASDVIKCCFPPGSMTGAPKIRAMEICSNLENMARGVYSGALGWIGGKSFDLSVVIRTLIIAGEKFEFQVGGAVTAESDPADEYEETIAKALNIMRLLNISEKQLRDL